MEANEEIELEEEDDEDNEELDYDDIDSDAAEYSSKSDFSKAKIIYEAMQKCIEARGKEMKSGYYNNKISNDGSVTKIWIEDTRQVFVGTIESLRGLLSPEIKNDAKYKEVIKKYYDRKNKIKDHFIYEERLPELDEQSRIILKETGRKFMPEIGSIVITKDIRNPSIGKQIRGGWDNQVNAYWDELIVLYDYIFAVLNDLINHMNYFKQQIAY